MYKYAKRTQDSRLKYEVGRKCDVIIKDKVKFFLSSTFLESYLINQECTTKNEKSLVNS